MIKEHDFAIESALSILAFDLMSSSSSEREVARHMPGILTRARDEYDTLRRELASKGIDLFLVEVLGRDGLGVVPYVNEQFGRRVVQEEEISMRDHIIAYDIARIALAGVLLSLPELRQSINTLVAQREDVRTALTSFTQASRVTDPSFSPLAGSQLVQGVIARVRQISSMPFAPARPKAA